MRPWSSILVAVVVAQSIVLAVVLSTGCRSPADQNGDLRDIDSDTRGWSFVDLADSRTPLESSLGEPERGPYFCDDQSGWGLALRPGERLSLEVSAQSDARLRLEVCARARESGEGGGPVGDLTVEWKSGELGRLVAPLGHRRWQTLELPLFPASNGSAAELSIVAKVPAGDGPVTGVLVLEGSQNPAYDLFMEAFVEQTIATPPPEEVTRVVLVSIDTLRQDAVAALDGHYSTPNLDRLIRDSEVFRPHYAGATWTKPSHATMLTGLPPWRHRVLSIGDSLPGAIETLAERLQMAGVETAGLAFGIPYFDARFGLAQGFEQWHTEEESAGRVFRRAANWLTDNFDQSFFLFVHTFEPHSDFSRLPYEGPFTRQRHVAREFGVEDYGCQGQFCASMRLEAINRGLVTALPGEAAILDHLYGRGVEETDRQLGVLLDELERLGIYQSAAIIVTSDHGESLLERGETLHARPREEILRVPLIVKWPNGRRAGQTTSTPTSSIDIAPTVLELFGLDPGEAEGLLALPGHSLREGGSASRVIMAGTVEVAVRENGYKALFGSDVSLFDLEADPLELTNIADSRPEVLSRLKDYLSAERQAAASFRQALEEQTAADEEQQTLSEEERRRLEALGYVE